MILINKAQAEKTQGTEKTGYPTVAELMEKVVRAIDVVMTTPETGYVKIEQICPSVKNGHVSRSTVMAAFKHAIVITKQIETHDPAAAGAVLQVLETVQAALTAPLTLGTAPAPAAAPAPAPAAAPAPAPAAAPATEAAQTELALDPGAPEVHVIKAKKAKA